MAKTKRAKSKENTKKNISKKSDNNTENTKASKIKKDITGVLILTFGVLLTIGLYWQESVGPFGDFVTRILGGLLGWPAVILPIIIVGYAITMLFAKNKSISGTGLILFIIFVMLISSMVQTSFYSSNQEKFVNMAFGLKIKTFFNDGQHLHGGGALGALFAMPLISVFQILGTIVIITALMLITVIYITHMTIREFFHVVIQMLKQGIGKAITAIKAATEKNEKDEITINPQLKGFEDENDGYKELSESKPKNNKKVFDFKILDSIQNPAFEQAAENIDYNTDDEQLTDDDIDAKQTYTQDNKQLKQKDTDSLKDENMEKKDEIAKGKKDNAYQYEYPKVSLLTEPAKVKKNRKEKDQSISQAKKLIDTLNSFGVEATISTITKGPAIIRYELKPEIGVRTKKFVNLADDIALNLAARSVRIEAPIPGKDAIGIEIPKSEVSNVFFKEMVTSPEFLKNKSKLAMVLGKDIAGNNIVADIAKMPHLLIAGATGSGKSVCINSLIMSILYKASPDDVRMLMIDPKMVELSRYNGIPQLLIPVVTDPKKAAGALSWVVEEMLDRYNSFHSNKVVDIESYNQFVAKTGKAEKMPQIVIIIDELADLMTVAKNDVEDSIQRLAQMARAAGMHLVIATQRPSVNVITGVIKANIPSRISFAVSSPQDSRTILDKGGAEKLLGKGDMLYHPVGENVPLRIQGTYVSNEEVARTVKYIKSKFETSYEEDIIEKIENEASVSPTDSAKEADEFLNDAIEMVVKQGQASTSYVQRKFSIGYARAGRIIDQMEERGIIEGHQGSKPRNVLISKEEWKELKMKDDIPSVN